MPSIITTFSKVVSGMSARSFNSVYPDGVGTGPNAATEVGNALRTAPPRYSVLQADRSERVCDMVFSLT